jgi:CubicO group peptidase (beta-lactamase class C family)
MTSLRPDLAHELTAIVAQRSDLVPAVSLAYTGGGDVFTAGWGASADTLFQAASVSKAVAAFLALCLVGEGTLELDDDIAIAMRSWSPPPAARITLRRVLCHGAGLGVHGFPGYERGERLPALVNILDGRPPANTPRVRVEGVPGPAAVYSGGGYMVLQQLIEDATGRRFADLAAERIFRPLGMKSATFEQPLPAALEPRVAAGFSAGRPIEGGWHVYPELAAAGLWCTPSDLVRFAVGVQRAFEGERAAALIPRWLAVEMLTPQLPGWGLGVGLYGASDSPHFGHTGGNAGYRCQFVASVRCGPAAAVMTNADEGDVLVPALLTHLARRTRWNL